MQNNATMTAEQIVNYLQENIGNPSDLEDYGENITYDLPDNGSDLGKIEVVDHYGGEGQGEDLYTVWHFVDHDVYIKAEGYYHSYDGGYYTSGWLIVRPEQKTITVYN